MDLLSPLMQTNSNSWGTGVQNRGGEPESRTAKGSHPSNFGQPPWGALIPKAKGVWAPMVLSEDFRNLLESSRTFQDHSQPFRDLPGWFWDVPEPSGLLPEPFGTVSGCYGSIWIGSGLIWATVNYPNDRESLSVRPSIIWKLFRLILDFPTTILTCSETTWHISRVIRALPQYHRTASGAS